MSEQDRRIVVMVRRLGPKFAWPPDRAEICFHESWMTNQRARAAGVEYLARELKEEFRGGLPDPDRVTELRDTAVVLLQGLDTKPLDIKPEKKT